MRKDKEVAKYVGIKPRRHSVRITAGGNMRYPWKAMIVNDYFIVESMKAADAVRNALKTMYRKSKERKYTVRQPKLVDGLWIVRRVQ